MRDAKHHRRAARTKTAAAAAVVIGIALCDLSACRHQTVEGFPAEFVGVGLELSGDDTGFYVVRVLADGPAAKAGMLAGDRLIAIDGDSTEHKGLGDVVMALRGRPNTQVTVSVTRHQQRIIFVVRRLPMTKVGNDYQPLAP